MSMIRQCLNLVGIVVLIAATPCVGQMSWDTVDSPDRVEYLDITTDTAGHVYAVGSYYPVSGSRVAILRRSLDVGQTWETVAMPPTPAGSGWSQFKRVAVGPAGQVYVLRVIPSTSSVVFELWRSLAGNAGSNLTLTTTFDSSYSQLNDLNDLAADAAGNIYVCGLRTDSPRSRWQTLKGVTTPGGIDWSVIDDYLPEDTNRVGRAKVIAVRPSKDAARPAEILVGGGLSIPAPLLDQVAFRRSLDGGATWTTVGIFDDNDRGGGLRGLAMGEDGTAFTVGRVVRGNLTYAWVTRRSTDGGVTWETVDDVGNNYGGRGVAVDFSGRVFGSALRWAGKGGALVRTSANGAAGSWQNADSFGFDQYGDATAVVVDLSGNAYVCGYMADTTGGLQGVVRKLAAPLRPKLELARTGSQLRLWWPSNTPGFQLQSATTLADGGNWGDVLLAPVVIDGRNTITVEATDPAAFFRLRMP